MRKLFIISLAVLTLLCACTQRSDAAAGITEGTEAEEPVYLNITPEEAKEIMDTQTGYIVLDVRTQEEYDSGHIPGAVLIPDNEIRDRAEAELEDRAQLILVYCRSGRRSKNAAQALAELGYTNVSEFGGIIDWPYELE